MSDNVSTETEIRWYCKACSDLVGVGDYKSVPEDCIDCTVGSSGNTLWEKMQSLMSSPPQEGNTTNLDLERAVSTPQWPPGFFDQEPEDE